jgi:DNA-binding MarR family transcriptional regulator
MSLTHAEWHVLDLLLEQGGRSWRVGELIDAIGAPSSSPKP